MDDGRGARHEAAMASLPPGTVILQVTPALNAGGVERTTLDMAEAIARAGGTVLVASAGGRLEGELAACGGRLIRLPLESKNPLTIWRNAGRLARAIRKEKVSLVHVRSRAPAFSAIAAARRCGVPVVTTYHGVYNARSAIKRWYNGIMTRGDLVIDHGAVVERDGALDHARGHSARLGAWAGLVGGVGVMHLPIPGCVVTLGPL